MEVVISTGLIQAKDDMVKPVRGKIIIVKMSNMSSYSDVLIKAKERFKAFYSNYYIESEEYVLLYESGMQAQFMPGTTDFFCLKKYHEETGKDYKRIVLYLCTQSDLEASDSGRYNSGNESDEPAAKKANVSDDEMLAIQIQAEQNEEFSEQAQTYPQVNAKADKSRETTFSSCESLINHLKRDVDNTKQFHCCQEGGPYNKNLKHMEESCKQMLPRKCPNCAICRRIWF